ncbi:MAG: putative zinc-binding protein, partial [Candidatus Omnitrophica bacterium]|nr:putative zinc-binding protein [Candidatus Omnitrophota bacterium]
MARECLCRANEIVVFPCSGGSNCGQIANQVAVDLTKDGIGTIFCLAGIGAHIPGMIESARSAKRIVAIDGCSVACAKKTIEHAGLNVTDYIDIAKEGIVKNKNFRL